MSSVLRTLLPLMLLLGPVRAQDAVVGVNVVNPMRASVADQNAVLSQLGAAHMHIIRCGISSDDKGIDYAKRAKAKGIRILLGVGAEYSPNAPTRPYQPDKFPAMWSGHPLSYADPELSKPFYQKLFDALDANGIVLAGIELGNEMNWAAFNAEFPLPGEGKILSLADLSQDPEGKQIAKGFLQYVKIIAVLKEVRDHSRLNRTTPLISAGMVTAPDGGKLYNDKREDMVSLSATMTFLRANGLDALWTATESTLILRAIIREILWLRREELSGLKAWILLRVAQHVSPEESRVGSPNGVFRTMTSRVLRRIRLVRYSCRRCV